MNSFLPTNYTSIPKSPSNYLKFIEGANKFRIVSRAVIGYEYWTNDNKPVRLKEKPSVRPSDIRMNDDNSYTIKHFWAFTVIDRADETIKICEVTQSTIQESIKAIVDNEDWGDPKGFDITVTRKGKGIETEYTVQPSPHKALTDLEKNLVDTITVNLEALFTGENPFDQVIDINKI